jgi:hypothetical protein
MVFQKEIQTDWKQYVRMMKGLGQWVVPFHLKMEELLKQSG